MCDVGERNGEAMLRQHTGRSPDVPGGVFSARVLGGVSPETFKNNVSSSDTAMVRASALKKNFYRLNNYTISPGFPIR